MKIYFTEADVKSNIEAIQTAGMKLVNNGCVVEEFITACTGREVNYPTGLFLPFEKGVAMPHGESKYVKEDSISVVRTSKPVTFHRMEDVNQTVDTQLVFNLALSSGQKHLQILRKLMQLFQNEEFIDNCLNYDQDKMVSYIETMLEI